MILPTLMLVIAASRPQPAAISGGAEFPAADVRIWLVEQSGLTKKAALARAAEQPLDPETVRLLVAQNRLDEALDCLMRIVDAQPARMADALSALWSGTWLGEGTHDYSSRLTAIVRLAHERARTLPREQAAMAELQLLEADVLVHPELRARARGRRAEFIRQYAGTEAALTAQISDAVYLPYLERLAMLDRIVEEHPRTEIAARALFEKAFQLGHNAPVGPGAERDPTERFLQAVAIEKELESGAYPETSDTRRAPSLVIEFYAYQPAYRPGSVDRMLAAYGEFVRTHFALDPVFPDANGIGYVITQRMADLFAVKGDNGGVDRMLRELERDSRDADGARYLRAIYVSPRGGVASPEDRARRRELLASLAASSGLYARKALATLASLDVEDRDYAAARARYQAYVDRYPESAYAWLAAIRIGEMQAALGDWKSAAAAFRAAARRFAAHPVAAVVGRELAARALEAQGDPDTALDEHAAALAAWDDDYGLDYPLSESSPGIGPRRTGFPQASLRKPDLAGRVAQLRSTLAQPGGTLLERARWLLSTERPDAAIAMARDLLARFPQSRLVAEGRRLMHRAQLDIALDLGNIERPGGDPAAARAALDALAGEPLDTFVSVARIARASTLWTSGAQDAARTAMAAALEEWAERQSFAPPSSDLEKDVAAIREAVFRPLGGGIFDQARGWNAFRWPAALPAYVVINPDVPVKLPSGELVNLSVSRALPGMPNAIYADTDTLAVMDTVLFSLGGTKRRAPAQIMETPNQPVGQSMSILQLWNEFFPARQGHWGGWELTTYPQLTQIEFLDAAHLQAAASVTVGYSGATLVLEKRDGVWIAVKLTNQWVT